MARLSFFSGGFLIVAASVAAGAGACRDFVLPETERLPAIERVSPSRGFWRQEVEILGRELLGEDNTPPEVYFGAILAPTVEATAERLLVYVPEGAPAAPVTVKHDGGESASPESFEILGPGEVVFRVVAREVWLPSRFVNLAVAPNGSWAVTQADDTGLAVDPLHLYRDEFNTPGIAFNSNSQLIQLRDHRTFGQYGLDIDVVKWSHPVDGTDNTWIENVEIDGLADQIIASPNDFACVSTVSPDGLHLIDLAVLALTQSSALAAPASALAIRGDGSGCFATTGSPPALVEMDAAGLQTELVTNLGESAGALALTPDEAFLFVVDSTARALHRIDTTTWDRQSLELPGDPAFAAALPDTPHVLVTLRDRGLVAEVQVDPLAMTRAFDAPGEPSAIAVNTVDGAVVVAVADDQSATVRWLDPQTGATVRQTLAIDVPPNGMALEPTSGTVFMATPRRTSLLAFDPEAGQLRPELGVPGCVRAKALSASRTGGWVAGYTDYWQLCVHRPGIWSRDLALLLTPATYLDTLYLNLRDTVFAEDHDLFFMAFPWDDWVVSLPLSSLERLAAGEITEAEAWEDAVTLEAEFAWSLSVNETQDQLIVYGGYDAEVFTAYSLPDLDIIAERIIAWGFNGYTFGRDGEVVYFYMSYQGAGVSVWREGLFDGEVVIYDLASSDGRPFCLKESPNRRVLYVGTSFGLLLAFDTESGDLLWRLDLPETPFEIESNATGDILTIASEGEEGAPVLTIR